LPEKETGGKAWIGYTIAAVVLIGIIFVYYKYKKTKSGEGFHKRMGNAESKIRGGLP